jgi:hypothetical protein
MTEEERAEWQRRCMRFQESMMNTALKPSTEARLDWLEADSAAQRTAILRLEIALVQAVVFLVVAGIAFGALALAVLT